MDLPDDCLFEILKRLSVVDDWIELTQTCSRFKEIAIETFARSQKICHLNRLGMAMKDTATACRVLDIFGASIVELFIAITDRLDDGAKIIDSIIENCTSLKSLSIASYTIPDSQREINQMALLFERLEILKLADLTIEDVDTLEYGTAIITPKENLLDLFANCNSLIDLTINNCCDDLNQCVSESYFPKLEHFRYIHYRQVCYIEGFVLRHRKLKSFTLNTECDKNSDFLKIVTTNCKQLENLSFGTSTYGQFYVTVLESMGRLEHLTNLTVALSDQHLTKLVKSLQSTPLKVLDLQSGYGCSQILPAISTMNTLRVLKLNRIYGLHNYNSLENMKQLVELYIHHRSESSIEFGSSVEFDPVKVIDRLVNLKKFKFHANGFHIDGHLYSRLVNVVQRRSLAENRYLEIDFEGPNPNDGLYCPNIVAIEYLAYELL